jgi:hypothetical protein
MTKRLPQQVIKVKNYGDDWVNRLAAVLTTTEKMSPDERSATFRYLKSKYSAEWPSDNY